MLRNVACRGCIHVRHGPAPPRVQAATQNSRATGKRRTTPCHAAKVRCEPPCTAALSRPTSGSASAKLPASASEYHPRMQVATGTVVAGRLVVEGLDLPDGETVIVLTRETEEEVHVSPDEEAELLKAVAEADRGATISAEELFARLDRIR